MLNDNVYCLRSQYTKLYRHDRIRNDMTGSGFATVTTSGCLNL